jgi:predicted negative regulator of RcsB-dependent stress response
MDSKADDLPLSDKLWAWFESNKNAAVIGLIAVVVIGAIIGFVTWHNSETQTASAEALSNLQADQMAAGPNATPGALVPEFLKIADQYSKTPAGSRAILLAAGDLFEQGKFDQAKVQFDRFVREHSDSPVMGVALLGSAASLEAQGKTNEAVTAYQNLVERHPNDAAAPQAKFALGRIYESQGKPELAKSQYEDVLRIAQTYGGSSLANEATMRLEELRAKHPNLFAPPPSAPSASAPFMLGTNAPQLKVLPGTSAPQTKPAGTVSQQTNKPAIKLQPSTNK